MHTASYNWKISKSLILILEMHCPSKRLMNAIYACQNVFMDLSGFSFGPERRKIMFVELTRLISTVKVCRSI
jgi:hypothetical protein